MYGGTESSINRYVQVLQETARGKIKQRSEAIR